MTASEWKTFLCLESHIHLCSRHTSANPAYVIKTCVTWHAIFGARYWGFVSPKLHVSTYRNQQHCWWFHKYTLQTESIFKLVNFISKWFINGITSCMVITLIPKDSDNDTWLPLNLDWHFHLRKKNNRKSSRHISNFLLRSPVSADFKTNGLNVTLILQPFP